MPQGLTVSAEGAAERFEQALALARSATELPTEWLERSRRVGQAASSTFTPMLGTALLAKATDRRVDALALQQSASHRGYSARGLAKAVLVPLCVREQIDLRTKGAEPLNNSPFFREARVGTHLGIKERYRPELDYLVECLQRADFLEGQEGLEALAAFVRVRLEEGAGPAVVPLEEGTLSLPELAEAVTQFINANREGGRRGQAFVAACLDLVHPAVRSGAINDPSVHYPGDVVVLGPGRPAVLATETGDAPAGPPPAVVLAAEAKQKPVAGSEVLQFAEQLARHGVGKGFYAALEPSQPPLDAEELRAESQRRHGVVLRLLTTPAQLLAEAVQWSPLPLEEALSAFPALLQQRLVDFSCDPASTEIWAEEIHRAQADHHQ